MPKVSDTEDRKYVFRNCKREFNLGCIWFYLHYDHRGQIHQIDEVIPKEGKTTLMKDPGQTWDEKFIAQVFYRTGNKEPLKWAAEEFLKSEEFEYLFIFNKDKLICKSS